jgi:hypothetical protein
VPKGGVKVYQSGADLYFGGEVSFALRFRVLPLPLSRSPLCLLAGGEPIAFAVHLQDVDMMGEPVEQGAGEPFGAEYGSPFIERQIAGDQRGATFLALADLSLPKSRFERTDNVARQGSDAQQRHQIARLGVCRARPSRAKHAFGHCHVAVGLAVIDLEP